MSEQQEVAKREEARPGIVIMPRVDVVEDSTGITLTADLPGVPTDKLTVRVDGDGLLIEGKVALGMPEDMEVVYAEVQTPRYRRAFTLSRDLDTAKSDAAFKDGVLKLRIPKTEHAQPRRIEVKTG